MTHVKLDLVDLGILANLQAHGRMTNVRLAGLVGISPPPCLRRVRALEEAGYILGYHAELDPASLGYGVTVFAHVGLHSQAEADLAAFEERVRGWPMVRECYMLAGEVDFLLKVLARDWDAYQTWLTRELTAAPNVDHVKSALSIRTSKRSPGVPVAGDEATDPASRR